MMEKRTRQNTAGVDYIDVSAAPDRFAEKGVTLDAVRFKLHALTPDGRILCGWPAISALWRRTPGLKWLAAVGDFPLLRPLSGLLYDLTARMLYAWNKAVGRW